MESASDTVCNRRSGRAKLRDRVTSPCRRLLSRFLRPITRRLRPRISRERRECTEPAPLTDTAVCDAASVPKNYPDSTYPSPPSVKENGVVEPAAEDQGSLGPCPAEDGEDTRSPSLNPSALIAEHTEVADDDEEEMVPWREVSFLLGNAEFIRKHEILSLKEDHEAELSSVTEQKDDALRVVEELVAERDALFRDKMHWQVKFASAVAKKYRPSRKEKPGDHKATGVDSETDMETSQSRAGQRVRECNDLELNTSVSETPTQGHQELSRGIQQEGGLTDDSDWGEDPPTEFLMPSPNQQVSLNVIVGPNAPQNGPKDPYRQLAECHRRLEELEQRDLWDFQLRQDLAAAREARDQLQQKVDSISKENLYIRGLFSELTAMINALKKSENSDPKIRLQAAMTENLILVANCERAKKDLASVEKQLRLAKPKTRSRNYRLSKPPRRQFAGIVNVQPYKAQLLSHDRLTRAALQQSAVYLDNFKTALSMIGPQIQDDHLALQLSKFLRDALDRNEMLEREVWNSRHPDTLEYHWIRRDDVE